MKLHKLIYTAALCAAALAFAACNDVAEADRFIYVKPADVKRCVLIEDFTAQRCVNCPTAASAIETLQAAYSSDTVIAVGLYCGDLCKLPNGKPYPLYNETANWYYEQRGKPSQPALLVDRQNMLNNTSMLGTYVTNKLQQEPSLLLKASCAYDEASRNVDITVNAEGLADVNGNLQVWLVEDGITSFQLMPDGSSNPNYVHNHVFRATVNGQEGDAVSFVSGENVVKEYSYTLKEDWLPKNVSVVTFVYDGSGVQQAAKVKVIPTLSDGETPGDGTATE